MTVILLSFTLIIYCFNNDKSVHPSNNSSVNSNIRFINKENIMRKKSIKFILFFLIIALTFTACSENINSSETSSEEIVKSETEIVSEQDNSSSNTGHSQDLDLSNVEVRYYLKPDFNSGVSDIVNKKNSKSIQGYENDVVIYTNSSATFKPYNFKFPESNGEFVTINHIHDGKSTLGDVTETQLSEKDINNYIETSNRIFIDEINTKNIYRNDLYTEDSKRFVYDDKAILLRTNADWNIIPWKTKYAIYGSDNPPKEFWVEELEKVLDAETGGTQSPMIICESWSFDYDGKEVSFVTACNYFTTDEMKDEFHLWDFPLEEANYKNNDKVIYSMYGIFYGDNLLYYRFQHPIYTIVEEEAVSGMSSGYTYQVNDNGEIIEAVLVNQRAYDYYICFMDNDYSPTLIAAMDIDNTGVPTLLIQEVEHIICRWYTFKLDVDNNQKIDYYRAARHIPMYMPLTTYPLEYDVKETRQDE